MAPDSPVRKVGWPGTRPREPPARFFEDGPAGRVPVFDLPDDDKPRDKHVAAAKGSAFGRGFDSRRLHFPQELQLLAANSVRQRNPTSECSSGARGRARPFLVAPGNARPPRAVGHRGPDPMLITRSLDIALRTINLRVLPQALTTRSISTRAPSGSAAAAIVVRAGKGCLKCLA